MKYIIFFILTSCSPDMPRQKMDIVKVFYKRDIIISEGGNTYEGVAVLPQRAKYDFHIEARGNLDQFIITSCHRDIPMEKAWNVTKKVKRWWKTRKINLKREIKFTYTPNSIERDNCQLDLTAIEEQMGRHSFASIVFESDKFKLQASMNCSSNVLPFKGTHICQSRAGLFQGIYFKEAVMVADNNNCGIEGKGKEFEIELLKGQCEAVFISIKDPTKLHYLTLIGYDGVLVRK